MPRLSSAQAIKVGAAILEGAGTPTQIALEVAGRLVNSDRSGHPSHGLVKISDYVGRIRRGELDPSARPTVRRGLDGGPVILIDGHHCYGHLAARQLTDLLVERTRSQPVAIGGIVDASHTGRLGEWAERAVEQGVIFVICSASLRGANVAAYGAAEPRLGTNPVAFGVPATGGASFILDFATSAVAGAKIAHYARTGQPAPPGSLLDREGNPTTDPQALFEGGMLTCFGGHKGYGLSLLISLLGGCVVGQAAESGLMHGVLAAAFSPGLFADEGSVNAAVRIQLERMQSARPRKGFERVEVPGDFERRHRERSGGFVTIAQSTWDSLVSLGQALGLTLETEPGPPD